MTPCLHLQTTVDAVTEPPRDETDRAQTAEEATAAAGHPLALPPAGEARANGMALGETVRLDHLGPMVGACRDGCLPVTWQTPSIRGRTERC